MKALKTLIIILCFFSHTKANQGYRLWLAYKNPADKKLVEEYQNKIASLYFSSSSPTLTAAQNELSLAFSKIINKNIQTEQTIKSNSLIFVKEADFKRLNIKESLPAHTEGFVIKNATINKNPVILVASKSDIGLLYGAFAFIKQLQLGNNLNALNIKEEPKIQHRILNHWDNLDRTVERGYAGFSLWDWHKLPGYIDKRYIDYARANASIGINGTVLNNVNANALILTPEWIKKVKALADTFRPYGIKVYLSARFSSPIEIGGLKTADPLDAEVIKWWKAKADEIYASIPDFGGFLVKANSEGQPGPQDYKRTHAEGANVLARALAPHNGLLMYRAFVYANEKPEDRAKQGFNEFKPLDGKFDKNVIVQVKNGAIDFQPREPFHPLFGALTKTPIMGEFQITQEYLGMATNLAYLAPLFKECLDADTYQKGKGSTVAKVIDGSLYHHPVSAIAGVANIGNDINWTGHPFGQSNWYAFGKLAWNYDLSSKSIAEEWTKMTFHSDETTTPTITNLMLGSRETIVNYMTPLGLHHIMGWSHHYGPGPWIKNKPRADWTSVYYHQADKDGIGFDRTPTGSNATSQYHPTVAQQLNNLATCPEEFLLWFHHLPWDYQLKSGETLWNGIVNRYYQGAEEVKTMQKTWDQLATKIDPEIHLQVEQLLAVQYDEAILWRNSCVLYFQSFSNRPIPVGLEKPEKDLKYYESLEYKYVPGI
jgi:alpha-glucuronidase